MEQRLNSILGELADYAPKRNRDAFIESRGQQVIASALHLLKLIRESYDGDVADDLSKRLIRSIQSADEEKFRRRVRAIREAREAPKL